MSHICQKCSKEFQSAPQLRGHSMSAHRKDEAVVPPVPVATEPMPVINPVPVEVAEVKREIPVSIVAAIPQPEVPAAPVYTYDTNAYKALPAPLIKHLELTLGNWLRFLEVGQVWREDYGGFGVYIRIPKQFSTEWKVVSTPVYDNVNRKIIGQKEVIIEDYRSKPLKEIPEVIQWINLVKQNLIVNAYRAGVRLPSTNTGMDETAQTMQEYERSIAGIKN